MKKSLYSDTITLHSVKFYTRYGTGIFKRLFFICGMLFILLTASAEELVIGSWNIRGNSHFEEYEVIQFGSYFVLDKHIDILALQEVKLELQKRQDTKKYKILDKNNFLERFAQTLSKQTGGIWKYVSSAEYAIRETIGEYVNCNTGLDNAVLYRSDKVIVEDLHSGYPFHFDNFDISNYKMNMNHTNILKISSMKDQFLDLNYFYFINTHMPAADKNKQSRDIDILHQIYTVLDNNTPIILCGDFNIGYSELNKIFSDCFVECYESTTISAIRYVNSYDHFILNTVAKKQEGVQKAKRYTSAITDIFTGQIHYGNKVTTLEAFLHISDHVPIFMSIDTNL